MAADFPQLERPSARSVVDQIAQFYRTAIQQGRLRAGDRLPTIRSVAQRLQVTRNTVQEAYRRLSETGLVSATVGRGTTVAGAAANGPVLFSPGARAVRRHQETAPQVPALPRGMKVEAQFAELLPDQSQFPVEEFKESIDRVLQQRGADLLMYGHPSGSRELREQLAARRECADPVCSADEILITSGAQQGIDLVLRTFTAPGDAVAVAVPSYQQLFGLLAAHGLEAVPVATTADGVDADDLARVLARPGMRMLCLMPTFHNPTGRTMSLEQRQRLMEVVGRTRVPVLEDEFQRELRFAGKTLPSLRALDGRGLTITVRTFSKGLFPGVRTGWVQAPIKIINTMSALKRVTDLETSPLLQAALLDFMTAGALDRHLDALRAELAVRHQAAQQALADHMPDGTAWSRPEGGFALWVEGPLALDGDHLAEMAARRGVMVTPGRVFDPSAARSSAMRLSLSRVTTAEIHRGIEILGACAREWLARSNPDLRPNFL